MSVRRSIDAGRLAAAVQRPGIDPRVWLSLAVVDAVYADAEESVFADVTLLPGGEPETCLLGAPYAGDGFGAYFPLAVDDTVLVAVPSGDPQLGPVVITRMWSRADRPPPEVCESPGQSGAPSDDVVLRVRAGQRLRVLTSGDGDGVELVVEGNGDARILTRGSGKVYLSDDSGTEPLCLGTTLKMYLDNDRLWKAGHTHSGGTIAGSTGVPATPPPTVPAIEAEKVEGR